MGHVRWRPDLIWFDNTRACGSPSYYVQAMAGGNRPDVSPPVKPQAPAVQPPPFTGRIGVGTWRIQAEFKDITVMKEGRSLFLSDFSKDYTGWESHGGQWTVLEPIEW